MIQDSFNLTTCVVLVLVVLNGITQYHVFLDMQAQNSLALYYCATLKEKKVKILCH